MKLLIGIVGEIGSGKDTFTTFFKAAVAPATLSRLRFSDVLVSTLNSWDIPLTRPNLQNLAIIMDNEYGKGTLTHATKKRIKDDGADIVILEGIRWKTDAPMLRSFKNSVLVYITADPKVRFERIRNRDEKAGEANLTLEQFKKEGRAATEIQIPEIGKTADFTLDNSGTIDEFREKIEELAKKVLREKSAISKKL